MSAPTHVMYDAVVGWALELQQVIRGSSDAPKWIKTLSRDGETELRVTAEKIEYRLHDDRKPKWRTLDVDAAIDGVGVPLDVQEAAS